MATSPWQSHGLSSTRSPFHRFAGAASARSPLIRKWSREGLGSSAVALHGARHVFATATPQGNGPLAEQLQEALATLGELIHAEGLRGSIVHQAIFLRNAEHVAECRRRVQDFFGAELPATTYIAQPPCDGKLVALEALGVVQDSEAVQIERVSEQLVITRHNGVAWVHCSHVEPQSAGESVHERSLSGFQAMRQLLASAGVPFEQVARTWLYLGDIVGPEGETQRYLELNRARSDFYQGIPFGKGQTGLFQHGPVYPASTGIGTSNGDILMSAIAIVSQRDDVVLVPLENPNQVSAFDYAARYSPKSPKFSRAMAVTCRGCATIFISGTASITDSESRHLGDVARQTHQTLDNIAALISEANFQRHRAPGLGAALSDLALVRVYLKRPEDYTQVQEICRTRLGVVPTIYAVADVCRPELLVEIEGIAFSHRGENNPNAPWNPA